MMMTMIMIMVEVGIMNDSEKGVKIKGICKDDEDDAGENENEDDDSSIVVMITLACMMMMMRKMMMMMIITVTHLDLSSEDRCY